MISLFIKSGWGWFWELLFWLLIVELARVSADRRRAELAITFR
jgi:hypothetical protein